MILARGLRTASILVALITVAIFASCAGLPPAMAGSVAGESAASGPPPGFDLLRLAPVEVREYRGERLDSVTAFPEISIRGPQLIDRADWHLHVGGLVDRPLDLSYADVLALPRVEKVVTIRCVEGWNARLLWEGVRVSDVLDLAGYEAASTVLLFWAADGYSTSLGLEDVLSRDLILAMAMNGVELPPERGFPLALVAEDHWGYKWIKWLTRMEVSKEDGYEGWWESQGFGKRGLRGVPEDPEPPKPPGPAYQ
jgi:DMSO/TMAO reductase YedYZ molybdopterin-dependent catalytic subunit